MNEFNYKKNKFDYILTNPPFSDLTNKNFYIEWFIFKMY